MDIIIKKAVNEDTLPLISFYFKVTAYLSTHINYPKWTHGVYPGEESVKAAILAGTQYVCLQNGEIAGAFVMNTDPQGSYYKGDWAQNLSDGEYTVIHALAVDPDASGRGIAKKMVDFCIEKSKNEGYKAIRLDVVPGNVPARRLYEKKGFRFAGERDLDRGFEEIPSFELMELPLLGE